MDDDEEFVYDDEGDDEEEARGPVTLLHQPQLVVTPKEQVQRLLALCGGDAERLGTLMAGGPASSWATIRPLVATPAALSCCSVCFEAADVLLTVTNCGHTACVSCWQAHAQHTPLQQMGVPCIEVGCTSVVPATAFCGLDGSSSCGGGGEPAEESVWWAFVLARIMTPACALRTQLPWVQCASCHVVLSQKQPAVAATATPTAFRCPACRVSQCADCGAVPDHVPVPCRLAQQWAQLEAHFNGVLLADSIKPCPNPKCGMRIEKTGGCQHIKCPACSTHFCFTCLRLWADHGSGASFITCSFTSSLAGENGAPDMLGLPIVQNMLAEVLPADTLAKVLVRRKDDTTASAALVRLRRTMHEVDSAKRPLNFPFDVTAVDDLLSSVAAAAVVAAAEEKAAAAAASCCGAGAGAGAGADMVDDEQADPDADYELQHAFARAVRELGKARHVLANAVLLAHFDASHTLLESHIVLMRHLVNLLHEEIEAAAGILTDVTTAPLVIGFLRRCLLKTREVKGIRRRVFCN